MITPDQWLAAECCKIDDIRAELQSPQLSPAVFSEIIGIVAASNSVSEQVLDLFNGHPLLTTAVKTVAIATASARRGRAQVVNYMLRTWTTDIERNAIALGIFKNALSSATGERTVTSMLGFIDPSALLEMQVEKCHFHYRMSRWWPIVLSYLVGSDGEEQASSPGSERRGIMSCTSYD